VFDFEHSFCFDFLSLFFYISVLLFLHWPWCGWVPLFFFSHPPHHPNPFLVVLCRSHTFPLAPTPNRPLLLGFFVFWLPGLFCGWGGGVGCTQAESATLVPFPVQTATIPSPGTGTIFLTRHFLILPFSLWGVFSLIVGGHLFSFVLGGFSGRRFCFYEIQRVFWYFAPPSVIADWGGGLFVTRVGV